MGWRRPGACPRIFSPPRSARQRSLCSIPARSAGGDLLRCDEAEATPSVMPCTPQHFEPAWADAVELLRALRNATSMGASNAIFSFTTDGFPLLGAARQVRGFSLAEAIWITHAA